MASNNTIDIIEAANNGNLEVSIRSDKGEDPKDAHQRRVKDMVLFLTVILMVLCAFAYCSYLVFHPETSNDSRRWAMATLTSMISGLLVYIVGQKMPR